MLEGFVAIAGELDQPGEERRERERERQSAMANEGDILMLEAPPTSEQQSYRSIGAEIIDSLPYIDDDYGDPRVKAEVDRLVEDEMRRSSKKPSDFLKDLPSLPKSQFQVLSLSAQIIVRVLHAFLSAYMCLCVYTYLYICPNGCVKGAMYAEVRLSIAAVIDFFCNPVFYSPYPFFILKLKI